MKCKIPNRDSLIDNYILKTLSNDELDAETEKFEGHFLSCDICFNEVKFRTEVISLIKDEGIEIIPEPPILKRIIASIERFIERIAPPSPPPRWVYGLVLVLLVGGSSYFVVQNFINDDPLKQYVFVDEVPYAFDPSGNTQLHGTSNTSEDATALESFNQTFLKAMLEYGDRNYKRSIEILTTLQITATEFQEKSTDAEILTLLRDYHFYLGVSHLAISTSPQMNVDEQTKRLHLEDAIQELLHSTTLAIKDTLDLIDRDRFFLGLSYGFTGQHVSALEELNNIDSGSAFFERSMN